MDATSSLIWNRACFGGGELPQVGDWHLASVLRFHGAAMNGGVMHAIEFCSPTELKAAKNGFVYLGVPEVIPLIEKAAIILQDKDDPGQFERALAFEYGRLAKDSKLSALFEAKFTQAPRDFAPIQ